VNQSQICRAGWAGIGSEITGQLQIRLETNLVLINKSMGFSQSLLWVFAVGDIITKNKISAGSDILRFS